LDATRTKHDGCSLYLKIVDCIIMSFKIVSAKTRKKLIVVVYGWLFANLLRFVVL
jgi:hypothetical protein